MDLIKIASLAKEASKITSTLTTNKKNEALKVCADFLFANIQEILNANNMDLENATKLNLPSSFIDRLKLTKNHIEDMANGLIEVSKLPDPIGQCEYVKSVPSGLQIAKKVVPMGVIGIIYESRPNVTSDAFALCLKAGSSTILRGGKEAINSNKAIVKIIKDSLKKCNITPDCIQFIENPDRSIALQMMKLNEYIDLLIPRGSAGLIKTVVENSTVPIIETGTGNCHIFVDKTANFSNALNIIVNSKLQKPSACNSLEKVLIHKEIANEFLPLLYDTLKNDVLIKCCSNCVEILKGEDLHQASEEDWSIEYLDKIIAIKIVNSLEDAIFHISKYSTRHSDGIITEDYSNANKFTTEVDSAVVYVNSSTRFSDGNEFGFGAEIGISTQKLHARGPMGLKEITSYKYIVLGNGQIR